MGENPIIRRIIERERKWEKERKNWFPNFFSLLKIFTFFSWKFQIKMKKSEKRICGRTESRMMDEKKHGRAIKHAEEKFNRNKNQRREKHTGVYRLSIQNCQSIGIKSFNKQHDVISAIRFWRFAHLFRIPAHASQSQLQNSQIQNKKRKQQSKSNGYTDSLSFFPLLAHPFNMTFHVTWDWNTHTHRVRERERESELGWCDVTLRCKARMYTLLCIAAAPAAASLLHIKSKLSTVFENNWRDSKANNTKEIWSPSCI